MSFMKETAAPAVFVVEGSAALEVVEIGLGHLESQVSQGAVMLAQDPRPDVIMADPITQLEFRPEVVEEKKSKKSSLEKASSVFKIKSTKPRYVKRQKCKNNIYLLFFTI